jgi:7-carboxy-7-deazaguanine synthase
MVTMKVHEIFESIQGEGRYAGYPAIFVRLSGCTRDCSFCDTKYHKEGTAMDVDKVVERLKESNLDIVIWTGGEPLMQILKIQEVIRRLPRKYHHLETNGDLLLSNLGVDIVSLFNYICVSPKDLTVCKQIGNGYDIKVVTNLEINKEMIPYATMLMPLTVYDEEKDREIQQKVWSYCVENNIRFCLRQHICVWGAKKGI